MESHALYIQSQLIENGKRDLGLMLYFGTIKRDNNNTSMSAKDEWNGDHCA